VTPLTEEQKKEILHHYRAAALARATQWDHESEVERILGYEISDFMTEHFAAGIGYDPGGLEPDDMSEILAWEDIEDIINDNRPEPE
jgi:hypothetical protein